MGFCRGGYVGVVGVQGGGWVAVVGSRGWVGSSGGGPGVGGSRG